MAIYYVIYLYATGVMIMAEIVLLTSWSENASTEAVWYSC